MVRAAPSSVSAESAGAAVPTRPLGAAWETSGCRVQPATASRRTNGAARPTIQRGPRPVKLVDRAGLGLAERSPKAEARPGHPRHGRQQGLLEDFVNVPDQDELHRLFDLVRHLVQVFAIFLVQAERFDPGPLA